MVSSSRRHCGRSASSPTARCGSNPIRLRSRCCRPINGVTWELAGMDTARRKDVVDDVRLAGLTRTQTVGGESVFGDSLPAGVYSDGLLTVTTRPDARSLIECLEWPFVQAY